jgi:phage gp29-like protein
MAEEQAPEAVAVTPAKPKRAPLIRRATELPVVSWNDWDNVQRVKAAIRALEHGVFHQAAQIVEAMGRDDRISGCLETRTRALPAMPISFEPRGDGRMKKAVAAELEEIFETMYPDASVTELHQWGILLGFGLGENVWEYGTNRWNLKLKVWHPQAVTYRQDTRSFWVQTAEGQREVTPGDGQWILYTPYGLDRGWMHGKVRSLYVPWLMRTWGMRDWARYSEVHGHPIKKAVTPPGIEKEDAKAFLNEVAALGAEAVIATERVNTGGGAEYDRYDVELLEAMNNNWETFEHLIDKADACVAITLLGQNLSTEVKGGSFAATMAHMQIRRDVLQFDAESLGQCLRAQSIGWWALNNFGSAELAPMPKWKTGVKSNEDKTARGTAMDNLGKGIASLAAAGVKVDVDKLTEEEEVPTTGPAEEPELPVLPQPGSPAAVVRARPVLPRPQAQASQGDGGELPPAALEGQMYIDRLADDGAQRLQTAMASDVRKVLDLIADAPDYGTLRKRLLDAYGEMDAEAEMALLHQGLIMSELAGRLAARKEAGKVKAED